MIVKEIMKTAVGTCAPDTDLSAVIAIMRSRDCGFLPVVDSQGIVVGVVTDRDVLATHSHDFSRPHRCKSLFNTRQ